MLNDLIKWDGSGRATLPIRVTPKASANRIRIDQHPQARVCEGCDRGAGGRQGKQASHKAFGQGIAHAKIGSDYQAWLYQPGQNYRVSKNLNIADNLSFSVQLLNKLV